MTNEEAIAHGNEQLEFFSGKHREFIKMAIKALEQEKKTGHCRDCKWWKDSDGTYKRGLGAESICPINTKVVYDGEGYCYLFSKNGK